MHGRPEHVVRLGGTSISSPIMAGIQTLINEKTRSKWGNPNTVYYQLADAEYGWDGSRTCNSNTVNKTKNDCIFYDVTQGDNDGACAANKNVLLNCYLPKGDTYGVLSTFNWFDQPAYSATPGWDFPSGIGSVNAWNLLQNWPAPYFY